MKLLTFIFAFLFFTTFISCKKSVPYNKTVISGRLLESSSNPVPVTNYKLRLNQNLVSGILGIYPGINQTVSTDNDGKFSFTYSLESGAGLAAGSTNPNTLYITSDDTSKFKNLFPEFRPLSPKVDTNFSNIFLYKKINMLVRKVKFDNVLNSGEILKLITVETNGSQPKDINGPIAAGTTLTVDTIINFKISLLDLQTKKYTLVSALTKPSYQTNLIVLLDIGDENNREIIMNY